MSSTATAAPDTPALNPPPVSIVSPPLVTWQPTLSTDQQAASPRSDEADSQRQQLSASAAGSVSSSLPRGELLDFASIHSSLEAVPNDDDAAYAERQMSPSAESLSNKPQFSFGSPKSSQLFLEKTGEYRQVSDALRKVSPAVVRQVVRDHGEKCLFGSEYHLAFVINATLSTVTPSTLERLNEASGDKLFRACRKHLTKHLTTQLLDELRDEILLKASNDFLDMGMAKRLETISARQLVNALARAERLGYDLQDIVEEKSANGVEHVVPSPMPLTHLPSQSLPPQSAPTQPAQLSLQDGSTVPSTPQSQTVIAGHHQQSDKTSQQLDSKPANSLGIVRCGGCGRPCSGEKALQYHVLRRACEHAWQASNIGRDICVHCGCQFTSSGGLGYHTRSNVCGKFSKEVQLAVLAEIKAKAVQLKRDSQNGLSPAPISRNGTPFQHKTPSQMVAAATNPGLANLQIASRKSPGQQEDPYAGLSNEARRSFELEMKGAEEKYGALMQAAMSLPESRRESELARLKNSYNSKQSVTRKKYGIRLRERRSRAEIDQERNRLMGLGSSQQSSRSPKRARIDHNEQTPPTQPRHSPSRRVDMTPGTSATRAVSSLDGGLAGCPGPAEHVDPTMMLTPSVQRRVAEAQAQAQAQVEVEAQAQAQAQAQVEAETQAQRIRTQQAQAQQAQAQQAQAQQAQAQQAQAQQAQAQQAQAQQAQAQQAQAQQAQAQQAQAQQAQAQQAQAQQSQAQQAQAQQAQAKHFSTRGTINDPMQIDDSSAMDTDTDTDTDADIPARLPSK